MPKILDGQPEIYRHLLPEFLNHQIPEETKATCSSCAMCESNCQTSTVPYSNAAANSAADGPRFFSSDTKCCTYHPNLPNFLVGAILAQCILPGTNNSAHEGQLRIGKKIVEKIGVTPYGINAPAKYNFLYQNSRDFFGRSKGMLCPYYIDQEGGLCSIWAHRDAVC